MQMQSVAGGVTPMATAAQRSPLQQPLFIASAITPSPLSLASSIAASETAERRPRPSSSPIAILQAAATGKSIGVASITSSPPLASASITSAAPTLPNASPPAVSSASRTASTTAAYISPSDPSLHVFHLITSIDEDKASNDSSIAAQLERYGRYCCCATEGAQICQVGSSGTSAVGVNESILYTTRILNANTYAPLQEN